MSTLTTVEFPTSDADASARFFADAFGLGHTAYGPEYSDVDCGDGVTLGFQQDATAAPSAPLAVLRVTDLDSCRSAVEAAGGVVTVEAFDFPGGRRFHFCEPGGSELAAWVPVP